ncbi:MAG TPA: homoserine O-succinyltransferase [Patescibacteria group bacterium]|nr:homoserine O-succinyltransferase [Patescibacteria group bacterium]
MPVIIPDNLPAKETLLLENIFVMTEKQAKRQDIRPLQIAILNLMPDKITTEVQILRLLSNTPLQIEVTFIHMKSHNSKNTAGNHLSVFYRYWDDIRGEKFDGMLITGAPVEHLPFEEVDYWPELGRILKWTKTHVYSTLHICWGAQAGLYYHYGIPKYNLSKKMFGVFPHRATRPHIPLLKGFDDTFYVPHSRHTRNRKKDIDGQSNLEILATSPEAGLCLAASKDGRQIYITGHFEYDRDSLKDEYLRDKNKGLKIDLPQHYFPADDPHQKPVANWGSHANLLYYNWLNFYVYQVTPYDLKKLGD